MDVCFFYLLNFLYISNPVNRCFTMSCTLYTCLAFFIVVQPTCGSVQLSKQEMRSSRHGSEHAWYSLRSAMVEEAVSVPHWSSSAQLSNESEQLVRQATVPLHGVPHAHRHQHQQYKHERCLGHVAERETRRVMTW